MEYSTNYEEKYAIVIGINKYKNINCLDYACNDAKEFAETLQKNFKYKKENIYLILDEEATKDRIMNIYYKFNRKANYNDSLIVYYAGHGHTETAKNGDVGYLIPYDADIDNVYSFIRWDEFTRNAESIKAKHILFIMDACYSGLALCRSVLPGTKRFIKDMVKRYSRQVLTAGKGNETVSDANSPLPKHSIFTGHLLEGLNGKAKMESGIISANSLMAYVYQKVSNDTFSQQTPHYGYVSGDGDFIFNIDELKEDDLLATIPTTINDNLIVHRNDNINKIKELIVEERNKIKIYDLINEELRKLLNYYNAINFPLANVNEDIFKEQVKNYENSIQTLQEYLIITCYWGKDLYINIIKKVFTMLSNNITSIGGNTVIVSLRWYPIWILYYSCIIACYEAENRTALKEILNFVGENVSRTDINNILVNAEFEIEDAKSYFKLINDKDNYKYPFNEYLYKFLQPKLDDLLFLGDTYSEKFSIAEMIISLKIGSILYDPEHHNYFWGPPGRYSYKYSLDINKLDYYINQKYFDNIGIFDNIKISKEDIFEKFKEWILKFGW